MSPCSIGTSVSVAKYIKAPLIDAKRLAQIEFPPTSFTIHSDGIKPSCPGLPRKEPAIRTPRNRSGKICLANPQVDENQSPISPSEVLVK